MVRGTNAQIVSAIRATIRQLEQDPDVRPDDPALEVLKRLLVRRLAAIEKPDANEIYEAQSSASAVDEAQKISEEKGE